MYVTDGRGPMYEHRELLDFSNAVVLEAATEFHRLSIRRANKVLRRSRDFRETTYQMDIILNDFILGKLSASGFPVLSEESTKDSIESLGDSFWILDPLDGSLNVARSSGPSCISLAFLDKSDRAFGIVYRLDTEEMFVGGVDLPSTKNGARIKVSGVRHQVEATLATGIPASLHLSDNVQASKLIGDLMDYAKVRMLGSAAASLCLVAEGAVDVYVERMIKIWDVAAGLAIVEGAGGKIETIGSGLCLDARASNGLISHSLR